jgi:general secretion pathway protein G
MQKLTSQKGFTLIELLVVIAIIGLLSSVVIASLNGARIKGRDARRVEDLKQLQNAVELGYGTSYPGTGGTVYYIGTSCSSGTALTTTILSQISNIPQPPTTKSGDCYYYTPDSDNQGYCLSGVLENTSAPQLNSTASCATGTGVYSIDN